MWLIDGCYAPDFMVIILVHMYKGPTHSQITNFARCGQFRFRYTAMTDNLKLFIELNIATKVHEPKRPVLISICCYVKLNE